MAVSLELSHPQSLIYQKATAFLRRAQRLFHYVAKDRQGRVIGRWKDSDPQGAAKAQQVAQDHGGTSTKVEKGRLYTDINLGRVRHGHDRSQNGDGLKHND